MIDKADGGPAFPPNDAVGFQGQVTRAGMSLRDYFAAAALQGKLADGYEGSEASAAAGAYAYADAMLAARKETSDD